MHMAINDTLLLQIFLSEALLLVWVVQFGCLIKGSELKGSRAPLKMKLVLFLSNLVGGSMVARPCGESPSVVLHPCGSSRRNSWWKPNLHPQKIDDFEKDQSQTGSRAAGKPV